jgi:hypothetical protein
MGTGRLQEEKADEKERQDWLARYESGILSTVWHLSKKWRLGDLDRFWWFPPIQPSYLGQKLTFTEQVIGHSVNAASSVTRTVLYGVYEQGDVRAKAWLGCPLGKHWRWTTRHETNHCTVRRYVSVNWLVTRSLLIEFRPRLGRDIRRLWWEPWRMACSSVFGQVLIFSYLNSDEATEVKPANTYAWRRLRNMVDSLKKSMNLFIDSTVRLVAYPRTLLSANKGQMLDHWCHASDSDGVITAWWSHHSIRGEILVARSSFRINETSHPQTEAMCSLSPEMTI